MTPGETDGAFSVHHAVPLLQKYGFTATFYIWVVVVGMKNHMSWDEIRDLRNQGMTLGAHTMTHPYLTRIQRDDVPLREILTSKTVIESRTGALVTSMAYPFGQYDKRVVSLVRAAGYTSARSTWPGVVHSREGLFSLSGLLTTESEKTLVDSVQKYLALAKSGGTDALSVQFGRSSPQYAAGDVLGPQPSGPDPAGLDPALPLLKPPARTP